VPHRSQRFLECSAIGQRISGARRAEKFVECGFFPGGETTVTAAGGLELVEKAEEVG
jgi:hypothetical protein